MQIYIVFLYVVHGGYIFLGLLTYFLILSLEAAVWRHFFVLIFGGFVNVFCRLVTKWGFGVFLIGKLYFSLRNKT